MADSMVYTTDRSVTLAWVPTLCLPNSIGAPLDILSARAIVGVLICVVGRDQKVEDTKVILTAGINGEVGGLEYRHVRMAVLVAGNFIMSHITA